MQARPGRRSFDTLDAFLGKPALFIPAVLVLLAAMLAISILEMQIHSASNDEVAHLPAGITYWKTHDFRLNPQHPPLVKLISALPAMSLEPKVDLTLPAWQLESLDQWAFGLDLLYRNDADRLLFRGRLPILGLSLLLGVFVCIWARHLYGNFAGLLALFPYAFSPEIISHSHFITMDLAISAFFLITLFWLRQWLRSCGLVYFLAAGFCLGLALAAKFSGLILLLVIPAIFFFLSLDEGYRQGAAAMDQSAGGRPGQGKRGRQNERRQAFADTRFQGSSGLRSIGEIVLRPFQAAGSTRRLMAAAASFLALALLAAAVVQACYFFSPDLTLYWRSAQQVNLDHDPSYHYYLFGEFQKGGWWYYFPLAMLVKTPLPVLVLLCLSFFAHERNRARPLGAGLLIWLPTLLFLLVTMVRADNIGVRYVLPLYPMLFIAASRVVHIRATGAAKVFLIGLAALWYFLASIRAYPDHLAYFNELVGGPSRGHQYLDDSNLEWGQDFKRMAEFIGKNNLKQVYYFTWPSGSARYYGIQGTDIRDLGERVLGRLPSPGTYLMSVHLLLRMKLLAAQTGNSHYDWLSRYRAQDRTGHSFLVYRF